MAPSLLGARAVDDGARREVVIVADNRETLDGLQTYLSEAGLVPRCTCELVRRKTLISDRTLAVILFPDDYEWSDVTHELDNVEARLARVLLVLVTAHPQRCQAMTMTAKREIVIVPRPVWGWTILDAIRAHREGG